MKPFPPHWPYLATEQAPEPPPFVGTAAAEVATADVLIVVTVAVATGAPPVAVTADPALPATASVPPAMTAGPGATYEARFW